MRIHIKRPGTSKAVYCGTTNAYAGNVATNATWPSDATCLTCLKIKKGEYESDLFFAKLGIVLLDESIAKAKN